MTTALILIGVGSLIFLLGLLNIIFSQIGGILFLTGACVGIIARENKKYKAANEYMEKKIRNEQAERMAEQKNNINKVKEIYKSDEVINPAYTVLYNSGDEIQPYLAFVKSDYMPKIMKGIFSIPMRSL